MLDSVLPASPGSTDAEAPCLRAGATALAPCRDALLVCDPGGTLAFLNESAERLLGLDACLALGRHVDTLLDLGGFEGERLEWTAWAEWGAQAEARSDAEPVLAGTPTHAAPRPRHRAILRQRDGGEQPVDCEAVALDGLVALILIRSAGSAEDPANLAYRASHDSLTGLPNRAALRERLDLLHRGAQTLGGRYALLLLDLDRFKSVNDRFGHAAGDWVLTCTGQRIARHVRSHDSVGRWGGEEILCLLPNVERTQAVEVAERVRLGIEGSPVEHDGRLIRVTASIGVAAFPEDGRDPDTLLAMADSALYDAKRNGRNRVGSHGGAQGSVFAIAALVERALAEDRVRAAYQPIVDLRSGEPRAEEALARIVGSRGEIVEASTFVPAAEQLNLIHRIDRHIVQLAAARCAARAARGTPLGAIFVNLSADFLRHPELVAEVLAELRAHPNPCLGETDTGPGRVQTPVPTLVMEIAERQFVPDLAEARQVLAPLVGLGLGLAIDDFGSGWSSLSCLSDLPATIVKIEGSLVRRVCAEPRVRDLIRGIRSLAADLGLTTVAKGIEDRATLEALAALGIDWGQGFAIAGPELDATGTAHLP